MEISRSTNINITENKICYNGFEGILLGLSYSRISNNNISYNTRDGIQIAGTFNIISQNVVNYNGEDGIFMRLAYDNHINDNIINYNWIGISLHCASGYYYTNDNTISNNKLIGNIFRCIDETDACSGNVFINNDCEYNDQFPRELSIITIGTITVAIIGVLVVIFVRKKRYK